MKSKLEGIAAKPLSLRTSLKVAGQAVAEQREAAPVIPTQRILSSAHLAEGPFPELSEFEFGMIVAGYSFDRWMVRCMAAAGQPDMAVTEILVLHHVHHQGRGKKLSDICFTLNYEDSHVVNYALKKLLALGLLSSSKQGKEVYYSTSKAGKTLVEKYKKVRDQCLIADFSGSAADRELITRLAQTLRSLSGIYDQAARSAGSF
jgi:predicted MarR family transcription regulator